jgi:hypothetical protein
MQRFSDGISFLIPFELDLKHPKLNIVIEILFRIDSINPQQLIKYIEKNDIPLDEKSFNSVVNDILYRFINEKISCKEIISKSDLSKFLKGLPDLKAYLMKNIDFFQISRIDIQKWKVIVYDDFIDEIETNGLSDYISNIGNVMRDLKGVRSFRA